MTQWTPEHAQRRKFAQRRKNHPSEENLMRMILVKYFTVKVEEKKLKKSAGKDTKLLIITVISYSNVPKLTVSNL